MALKKDMKNKVSTLSSSNDKRGQMLIQIDSLMEKINDQYGPFILDELQKRLEFTIKEFLDDFELSENEFLKICEKFTNKSLFEQDGKGNLLRDSSNNIQKITNDN